MKLSSHKRVAFNEITEKAVKEAVTNPRSIDMQLVKAQEARRVLDRLVGYETQAPLTNIAGFGARAGRVQSPALRLVVEREQAISSFKSLTHYGVEVTFEAIDHAVEGWRAHWNSKNWLDDGQEYFLERETAEKIAAIKTFQVADYQESETKQAPPAPFTTSSLQQAASGVLKFSPKKAMELAQALYEAGAITYMRTDSPNLSEEAISDIRNLASQNDWPMPAQPRTWKSKDGAQEAHEAVRPTHFEVESAGIGRPSTYASTLDKLVSTNQVKLEKRQLVPTPLGERIVSALNGRFGFVDYDFTRSLEKRLDDIAEGQTDYLTVVSATFGLLEKELQSFGHACPECGKPLRHLINQDDDPRKCYDYWACTNRPDCPASFVNDGGKPGARREKKPALLSEFKCPKCGKPLAYRRGTGKNNKPYEFFGCSGYPDCTEKFSPKDGQPDFR